MSSIANFCEGNLMKTRGKFVLVLGWAGAIDRNVQKYSEIYEKKGFKTIRYTSPATVMSNHYQRDVKNLAILLKSINENERMIGHVFSMNGFSALTSLIVHYPELKILERCDGLFLDSCPIHADEIGLKEIRGHMAVMDFVWDDSIKKSPPILKWIYHIGKYNETVKYIFNGYKNQIMLNLGIVRKEDYSSFHFLLNHKHLPPILSLVYSDNDQICSADHIFSFQKAAEKRGCRIIATRHSDSSHVEHFRKHPKQYSAQIDKFLQMIEEFSSQSKAKL